MVHLLLEHRVLLLKSLRFFEVALYLHYLLLQGEDRRHLVLEKTLQIIQVVLDIAAYLIGVISQLHLLLSQLDCLVNMQLVLLYQLLLLL